MENLKNWKFTQVFIILVSFIAGILFISAISKNNSEIKTPVAIISPTPIIQEKIVYQDKIIYQDKVVYADKDRKTWLRIVDLDNKIFGIAGDGFANLASAITDISNGNYSNLPVYTAKQKDIGNQLDLAKLGRANLLKQVGL